MPPFDRYASTTRRERFGFLGDGREAVGPRPASQPAVSALTAAPSSGGGRLGRDQSRARCTPHVAVVPTTSSPASSRRIASSDSSSRALRSSFDGQGSPVMCSFIASPLPSAAQNRPGNISSSVAIACAITAG